MFDFVPVILFLFFVLFFIGAVFDVDWIMKLTAADRRYGRKFARIFWGLFAGFGIVSMIVVQISS
ncbi:MAG: hypothetical protein CL608_06320 [Anaerolineaceae bacterium]|nr:hypothetical protein [Anaerolineaceae bacterium]